MEEKVYIENKKRLQLASIIERPSEKGKFPCVILLHGFKGYKEEATYTELAKKLLKVNIASIRFDASGFGESEGDFEKEYRLTNYINDASMIYHYIILKNWVDPERIGVMGQSMGGAVSLILASKFPRIKSVVSVSPPDIFATKDDFGGDKLKLWKKKGYIEIESSRIKGKLKVPYAYADDTMRYDIREYAKQLTMPKLFILGLSDKTVKPVQTRSVYESASGPKELWEVEGMDHFFKNDKKILLKVNKRITEFFVKYL